MPQQQPVSPAARALSAELDREGPIHQMRLKQTGRIRILEELLRANLANQLEDGHVVSVSFVDASFTRIAEILPSDHRLIAQELSLSNGQARSLLAYLVRNGRIQRVRGRYSVPESTDCE